MFMYICYILAVINVELYRIIIHISQLSLGPVKKKKHMFIKISTCKVNPKNIHTYKYKCTYTTYRSKAN